MMNLSNRELQLLMVIYALNSPCEFNAIVAEMNSRFQCDLKIQTVSTHLKRLIKKNYVVSPGHGMYSPVISRELFLKSILSYITKNAFGNNKVLVLKYLIELSEGEDMFFLYADGYIYQTDFIYGNLLIPAEDISCGFSSEEAANDAICEIRNILSSDVPHAGDVSLIEHILSNIMVLRFDDLRILNAKNTSIFR